MKLLLENWRKYIKEIEAFDDFADKPEKIEKNLQYYYREHAPNKGKRKDLGEWEGNQLVVFLLSEDNKFFFVVNENDEPLAYIAVAPFRESYSVGNMSKKPGEKSFYQTEFYEKVMEVLGKGSLYSDSKQTTGGKELWDRFPNKEKVETEKEDGKGRWRYRIGKEVNEIFGFGKKKKKVDLGVEDLAGLSYDIDRIDGYIDTIKNTSGDFAKLHLEQLIEVYEENVDSMISRLMIAKSQIDKETHELESSIERKIRDYKNLYVVSWEDEADLLRQLLEVAYNLRNKILGAYKRYRNKVPELPAYKPKPGIHDLEKLMGQAKVREEGIMDFFKDDSTAPSSTDMSPEEREFHKQQFAFDAEDFQEMYDALKLYKVLMYGGRYRGTDQHKMRKSRKAWTQMGKAGRKRRLKEIAAFHDNVLRPMADKAAGYASEIESGTFVDATPRNDYWLSGINPKRIRKMLPKWAKAFESALRVSANFYKNEAPKYGLEEWEPQPGLEDIKDFMDLASIQEE